MASFNDYVKNSDKSDSQELLKKLAVKYEGASESEIVSAIIKEAEKNRAQGKLTDSDLDNFKDYLRPMLNDSQAKKLDKIIARLKRK